MRKLPRLHHERDTMLTRRRTALPNHPRRGSVLLLMAAMIIVLIISVGFGTDLARIQLAQSELRASVDSAARATAQTLASEDSVSTARNEGKRIARLNKVGGEDLRLRNSQVVFGASVPQNDGSYSFVAGQTPFNAVRVDGKLGNGALTPAFPLLFGNLWNISTVNLSQTATAGFTMYDICLVLDRSSSMKMPLSATGGMYTSDPRFLSPPFADSRWPALDDAVKLFTSILREKNEFSKVGVVTYASDFNWGSYSWEASTINQTLTEDLDDVDDVVTDLSNSIWNGNTYIEAGMRDGITVLTTGSGARVNATKVMIVFTDGWQNVGSADAAATSAIASGITIHSVGLGNADYTLLDRIAANGGGISLHAATEGELREAFEELASMMTRLIE